jgi:hypothetical protein
MSTRSSGAGETQRNPLGLIKEPLPDKPIYFVLNLDKSISPKRFDKAGDSIVIA